MKENDYYSIACRDLRYLQFTIGLPFYNNIIFQCEQIIEKLLKSVIELYDTHSFLLYSSNIVQLKDEVISYIGNIGLNTKDAQIITKYVNNTRYPGENYIIVNKEDCTKALKLCYLLLNEINIFRQKKGLEIENEIEEIL